MPHFLVQLAYTSTSAKAMIDHPTNRREVARKAVESLGGKLDAFYFCFGPFDAILLAELPDNVTAMALAAAIGSAGGMSKFETTPLATAEEAMAAMAKAKTIVYSPPA